jgi:uncharacterized RDD family membrane protein YckC
VEIIYPRLLKRIQSFLIDTVLKVVSIYAATLIFEALKLEKCGWLKGTILILIVVVYEPLSMRLGATVGNYVTGIRVRRFNDKNRRINLFQACLRYLVKILFGWLSCITIGFNEQKRAIHDLVAESIVIEKIK